MRDIDSLLEMFPNLDKGRVRHWVSQFAEVMEMPEIAERLELLLTPGGTPSSLRKRGRRKLSRKG